MCTLFCTSRSKNILFLTSWVFSFFFPPSEYRRWFFFFFFSKRLSVSGKPRRNGPVPEKPPIANVVDEPVAVTFYLFAYPTPEPVEYKYHGRVGNASDERKVVEKGIFTTHCWTTGALYNVSCNITTNITSDEEAGEYSVSIGNTYGQASFRFIVTFNGKSHTLIH